jgi:hypothetical protein
MVGWVQCCGPLVRPNFAAEEYGRAEWLTSWWSARGVEAEREREKQRLEGARYFLEQV